MRKPFLLTSLVIVSFYFFSKNQNPVENTSQLTAAKVLSLREAAVPNERKLLTRNNFEDYVQHLYRVIGLSSYKLDYEVFKLGMVGFFSLEREGAVKNKDLLTIIDFSKASTEKRFYTIDLRNQKLIYHTYVAHGRNTGQNMATEFSNTAHSNQSSLGFYVTGETYVGSKGYSLRLDGKEKSFNDKIRSRAVVIHAAEYATEYWIKRYGRLGRSQGCPALPPDLSRKIIDTIKDKTAIFTYYPDENYLNASRYLKEDDLFDKLDEKPVQLAVYVSQSQS